RGHDDGAHAAPRVALEVREAWMASMGLAAVCRAAYGLAAVGAGKRSLGAEFDLIDLGAARLGGLGDLTVVVLVLAHVLDEGPDDALEVTGADDDPRVDDPFGREDVHEIEEELLLRVAHDHLVRVDPLEDLVGDLHAHLVGLRVGHDILPATILCRAACGARVVRARCEGSERPRGEAGSRSSPRGSARRGAELQLVEAAV